MTSAAQTKRYCGTCGIPVFDNDQRFCESCGALLPTAPTPPPAATSVGGARAGLDGMVNGYIQERMRDSSAMIAQQVKQELKSQVRGAAEAQLRRNGGKIALYAGVGIAGLIVLSAIVSLITGLLLHLLPFALLIVVAYVGYLTLRSRMRRS